MFARQMDMERKMKDQKNRKQSFAVPGFRDKMKSDVFICLDKDDANFTAGEVLKGHVLVSLTSEVRIKEIAVKCFGAARVSWDEKRSYTKGSAPVVSHKDTEVYLDHCMLIQHKQKKTTNSHRSSCCPDDDSILLARGEHKFPFEYTLPTSLPRSYEGKWGQVKYFVKVALVRPWKFDIERELELTIDSTVDLNDDMELSKPACGLVENPRGFLCFLSGWVTAKVFIPRRGYTVGETVIFTAEVENMTPRKLTSVRLALVQHTVFRIGDRTRKISTVIMVTDKGEISPQANGKWESESFCIPSLPPSTPNICKAVQLRYTISVLVRGSSWEDEMTAPITIVIGTVPLRRRSSQNDRQNQARRGSQVVIESTAKPAAKAKLYHGFLSEACEASGRQRNGSCSRQVSREDSSSRPHSRQRSRDDNTGVITQPQQQDVIAHSAQVHSDG